MSKVIDVMVKYEIKGKYFVNIPKSKLTILIDATITGHKLQGMTKKIDCFLPELWYCKLDLCCLFKGYLNKRIFSS